ncbi:murein biosynthesis integral membrane protein MurJ [Hanstruepera marina]|uniref:murein biosynthesis integral membrane protein MurJ n=1 Tax=Hanstruepera marina TaxID=2873265 RepID=UPI0034E2FBA2
MKGQKLISIFHSLKKNPTVINIITVGAISIFVKGFGFFKEIVIAGEFGLSELLDTFYIALLVPGFINEVFINAFNTVFIPNYIAEEKTQKAIGPFQSTSFIVTICSSLVFMFIAFLFTDVYLNVFFSGHTAEYYALIKSQFYYLLPCILFWGLTSFLNGLLNIYDEFRYSTIYPVLTSIAMLICLLGFQDELKDDVLAIGMLIGAISQFLFLLVVSFQKNIITLGIPDFKNKNAVTMFKQVPAKVSSGFLTGLIPVADQFFAAQLIIGSIAALNYGLKIPAFITTILLLALGNVLLPYFSKLSVDNINQAYKKLYQLLKWLFILLISITLILIIFSNNIIELVFERNNFSESDTNIVSNVQKMFLIGLPFTICGNIVVRFLTSINKNAYMAYVSLVSIILNVILDWILMKQYGIMGIALCTAILQILRSLVLFNYTRKQHKLINSH